MDNMNPNYHPSTSTVNHFNFQGEADSSNGVSSILQGMGTLDPDTCRSLTIPSNQLVLFPSTSGQGLELQGYIQQSLPLGLESNLGEGTSRNVASRPSHTANQPSFPTPLAFSQSDHLPGTISSAIQAPRSENNSQESPGIPASISSEHSYITQHLPLLNSTSQLGPELQPAVQYQSLSQIHLPQSVMSTSVSGSGNVTFSSYSLPSNSSLPTVTYANIQQSHVLQESTSQHVELPDTVGPPNRIRNLGQSQFSSAPPAEHGEDIPLSNFPVEQQSSSAMFMSNLSQHDQNQINLAVASHMASEQIAKQEGEENPSVTSDNSEPTDEPQPGPSGNQATEVFFHKVTGKSVRIPTGNEAAVDSSSGIPSSSYVARTETPTGGPDSTSPPDSTTHISVSDFLVLNAPPKAHPVDRNPYMRSQLSSINYKEDPDGVSSTSDPQLDLIMKVKFEQNSLEASPPFPRAGPSSSRPLHGQSVGSDIEASPTHANESFTRSVEVDSANSGTKDDLAVPSSSGILHTTEYEPISEDEEDSHVEQSVPVMETSYPVEEPLLLDSKTTAESEAVPVMENPTSPVHVGELSQERQSPFSGPDVVSQADQGLSMYQPSSSAVPQQLPAVQEPVSGTPDPHVGASLQPQDVTVNQEESVVCPPNMASLQLISQELPSDPVEFSPVVTAQVPMSHFDQTVSPNVQSAELFVMQNALNIHEVPQCSSISLPMQHVVTMLSNHEVPHRVIVQRNPQMSPDAIGSSNVNSQEVPSKTSCVLTDPGSHEVPNAVASSAEMMTQKGIGPDGTLQLPNPSIQQNEVTKPNMNIQSYTVQGVTGTMMDGLEAARSGSVAVQSQADMTAGGLSVEGLNMMMEAVEKDVSLAEGIQSEREDEILPREGNMEQQEVAAQNVLHTQFVAPLTNKKEGENVPADMCDVPGSLQAGHGQATTSGASRGPAIAIFEGGVTKTRKKRGKRSKSSVQQQVEGNQDTSSAVPGNMDNAYYAPRTDIEVDIRDSQCVFVDGHKKWKCMKCPKMYTSKHNLVSHIMDHNGLKPYHCDVCDKYFKQAGHLYQHMLTHGNTKPYICQVCNRSFTQGSHLKRHMAVHMEKRPHMCVFCDRGFMYPSELKTHMEKHATGIDHTCEQCGQQFQTAKKMKQHMSTVHGNLADLTCKDCGKVFPYPSQLRDHNIKHTGQRPFRCQECGMDFLKEHHLKAHKFTHTGLRPFVCKHCNRAFNQKANLQRHVLIHQESRSYKCDICSRSFSQPQVLRAHMVTHAETKPFKCDVCGKKFTRVHNLNGHMHMHNGSKPHTCFCGASFTLKGNLNRHKKEKHGISESSQCTDEEAAQILNEMSSRKLYDSENNQDSTSDGGAPTPKKKRKSQPPRRTITQIAQDVEVEAIWEDPSEQNKELDSPAAPPPNTEPPTHVVATGTNSAAPPSDVSTEVISKLMGAMTGEYWVPANPVPGPVVVGGHGMGVLAAVNPANAVELKNPTGPVTQPMNTEAVSTAVGKKGVKNSRRTAKDGPKLPNGK